VVRAESERGSRDPDVHELIYKGYAAMFDAGASGLPALKQAEKILRRRWSAIRRTRGRRPGSPGIMR
jgi:hypothetical protein